MLKGTRRPSQVDWKLTLNPGPLSARTHLWLLLLTRNPRRCVRSTCAILLLGNKPPENVRKKNYMSWWKIVVFARVLTWEWQHRYICMTLYVDGFAWPYHVFVNDTCTWAFLSQTNYWHYLSKRTIILELWHIFKYPLRFSGHSTEIFWGECLFENALSVVEIISHAKVTFKLSFRLIIFWPMVT